MNDALSATATRPKDSRSVPVRTLVLGIGLAVVVGILALLASTALKGPSFVPSVSIANPSPYLMAVDVTAANSDEWTQVATIPPETTSDAAQVIDQGDSWRFRAESAGVSGGEFTLSRAALEQADWKVTVPESMIARFRAQNVPEAPPEGF